MCNKNDYLVWKAMHCITWSSKEIHNNSKSCGNFRAILKLLSVIKFDLKHHLDAPSVGSASNISPRVQNEVTEIVSYDI